MLVITNVLNPLTGGQKTEQYPWVKGKSLAEYMGYTGDCLVACGQDKIELPLNEIFPADKERYTVMPIPEGGDKGTWSILGSLATGGIRSPGVAAKLGGITKLIGMIPGWGWAAAFIVGYVLYSALRGKSEKDISTSQSYSWKHTDSPTAAQNVGMPIIYGKARIRPILKNRYITVEGDKQRLYALYGLAAHKVDERDIGVWSDRSMAVGEEVTPNPASLEPGKTYIYINQLSQRRDTLIQLGNKEFWKTGHGTAKFADHIIVNGRTITDYYNDVDWDTRPGLPQQMLIEDFDLTYTNYAFDESLYIDTISPDWTGMKLKYSPNLTPPLSWRPHVMYFHGEAFSIQGDTKTLSTNTKCYLYFDASISPNEYLLRKDGSVPSGYDGIVATIDTSTDKLVRYSTEIPNDATWIKALSSITGTQNIELMFDFPYGLFGTNEQGSMVQATCRLFAQYRKRTVDNSESWSNFDFQSINRPRGVVFDPPIDYADGVQAGIIKRRTNKAFSVSVKAVPFLDLLDYEETYEIRVCADAPTIVKLVNVATIVYGEENARGDRPGFTYPGEPLLGIRALASGQVSSDLDVQVDVERSEVWVRDGSNNYPLHPGWNKLAANNHAWAVYDILAQGHPDHPAYPAYGNVDAEAVYGCGIDYRRIDYDSFEEWADYITSIHYELNIVFDTLMTAWDAILRICQEGRGMVYPVGTKIFAFVDKPAAVTQIFTMGNIQLDSFIQQYTEASKKANMIEASYWDRERNYEETTIAARTADWDGSTGLNTPTSIKLYGTTTFDQAWATTRFMLMGNELLNNTIAFGADIDSLASQVGDVVEVQHDILTTGWGGRIAAVTGTPATGITLTLDRTITLVAGQQYELKIYHNDGTITTQYPITGGVATTQIVFDSSWIWTKTPEVYELYSFGLPGYHVNKYRIVDISRTNELMRTLTLVQYDAAMYDGYVPSDGGAVIGDGYIVAAKIPIANTSVGVVANLLNLASNLKLQEIISRNRVTGEYESSIVANWDTVNGDPRGSWEVWFRDVDESDVDWQGTWEAKLAGYDEGDKVEFNGKTYISLEDGNTTSPTY